MKLVILMVLFFKSLSDNQTFLAPIDVSLLKYGLEEARERSSSQDNPVKCNCSPAVVICACDELFTTDLEEFEPIIMPPIN
jgi:hypothetical protein